MELIKKQSNVLLMTPGPTYVSQAVRDAIAKPLINPDIDLAFYELYKETCNLLGKIMHTKNDVLILNGEGILGLEAACASLIEPGDRVLVLANGIFGEGFADFIKMYGGEPVLFSKPYEEPLNATDLSNYLKTDHDFKFATLVHCETPSGLINPIETLCPLLKDYGILTVVDAVSSIGGIPIECDDWQIDLLLGGSQKCLSSPPGLTFLSVSEEAWSSIEKRKIPITGFYSNLTIWKNWYENKWFPYTQPVNDIYGLHVAANHLLNDAKIYNRHETTANMTRARLIEMGFKLYPHSGYSNTVTAFLVPDNDSFDEQHFRQRLIDDYGIMITGAFGPLEGKVLRIGHMGENAYIDKVQRTLDAIADLYQEIKS